MNPNPRFRNLKLRSSQKFGIRIGIDFSEFWYWDQDKPTVFISNFGILSLKYVDYFNQIYVDYYDSLGFKFDYIEIKNFLKRQWYILLFTFVKHFFN